MEAKVVSIPTRVVCPTQKAGTTDHTQGTQGGRVQKVKQCGRRASRQPCPASLHLHKQRAQCATVLDLSTVVVRAVRRGSRRGSQRNGRASRALGARLHCSLPPQAVTMAVCSGGTMTCPSVRAVLIHKQGHRSRVTSVRPTCTRSVALPSPL